MSRSDRQRWNGKHRDRSIPPPNPTLLRVVEHFPLGGRILDLACGLGSNAMFVASRLAAKVDALDVSEVALTSLGTAARELAKPGSVQPIQADLDRPPLRPGSRRYDAILMISFLDRRLFPWIRGLLAPSGLLFCETFDRTHLERAPDFCTDFLLRDGELPREFSYLDVLLHESIDGRTRFLGRNRAAAADASTKTSSLR